MKHFNTLSSLDLEEIFYKQPHTVTRLSAKGELARALGATLYIPATKDHIAQRIMNQLSDLSSAVLCLEDSISDRDVDFAEKQLRYEVRTLFETNMERENLPLLFIRVRTPEQMVELAHELGEALQIVTGFVFPKFTNEIGATYLRELDQINKSQGIHLYAMPIIETEEFLYKETRVNAMNQVKVLFEDYRSLILNIRIGGTDLSGLYGMRRHYDSTIYDIALLHDFVGDMVNFFGRNSEEFMISGPVWEYFERSYASPLEALQAGSPYVHGFIREIQKDQLNGLCGKTVIHPSHIQLVNALHVVGKEAYSDALEILHKQGEVGGDGVSLSPFANKMNEVKPHLRWAKETLMKSNVYGVFHEDKSYIHLLEKSAATVSSNR